jgi:hypothetical protein
MSEKKPKEIVRQIAFDPNPKGKHKDVGGAAHDEWNDWLTLAVSLALPINQSDETTATQATLAVYSGMVDLKPADPLAAINWEMIIPSIAAIEQLRPVLAELHAEHLCQPLHQEMNGPRNGG